MYRDDRGRAEEISDLKRRLRVLETQAPIGFSSVSRGALRIVSPEGLIVDGSARISGVLDGDGTLDWTGPVNLKGAQSVTGPTTFTGNVNLTGDLNVTSGGKITAGAVTIDPSTAGGTIGFGSGRSINASTGFMGIYDGSQFIVFNSGGIAINGGSGSPTLIVGPGGMQASGIPTRTGTGLPSGAVGADIDGTLWRAA